MNPLLFAWRSLTREPVRALLGVAGIAVVGALLLDMLLLSNGLLLSFRDLLRDTGFEVRVTATEALPGAGPPIVPAQAAIESLRGLPELEEVVAVRADLATTVLPGGRPNEVTVIGMSPRHRSDWKVVRGTDLPPPGAGAPADPPPAVVNTTLARVAHVEPGSVLELQPGTPRAPSTLPAFRVRVVGVAEFPFDTSGERTLAMEIGAFRRAQVGAARDEADVLLIAPRRGISPEVAVAAVRRARPDLHPFSIEDFLERFAQGDFSYFRQISAVLSVITSGFTFLLVTTLLTVSVNQRLGEVAALRALGFTRSRIASELLCEAGLLVGAGAVLAVPTGLVLARVLDDILRDMPQIPQRIHFFVPEPGAMLLHGVLLALAALLSALYPIARAVRLPIAATLRQEVL